MASPTAKRSFKDVLAIPSVRRLWIVQLVSPLAGVFVDKWNVKWTMIFSDARPDAAGS